MTMQQSQMTRNNTSAYQVRLSQRQRAASQVEEKPVHIDPLWSQLSIQAAMRELTKERDCTYMGKKVPELAIFDGIRTLMVIWLLMLATVIGINAGS